MCSSQSAKKHAHQLHLFTVNSDDLMTPALLRQAKYPYVRTYEALALRDLWHLGYGERFVTL